VQEDKARRLASEYWEGVPGKQVGNVKLEDKAEATMRVFGGNIKQVKKEGKGVQQRIGVSEMEDMTTALLTGDADVFLLADTGLEDGQRAWLRTD
jgi:hypothetical protein